MPGEQDYEQIVRETPAGKPVLMTLDDLDDFGGVQSFLRCHLAVIKMLDHRKHRGPHPEDM